jgi:hypothetical protein
MTVRTIPDVPADEVDMIESDFISEGCTVEKKQQAGSDAWTVIGTCPDAKKS